MPMVPEGLAWLQPLWTEQSPAVQGALLGLATLVQEDVPTVGAAVLAAGGHLSWPVAWLGCFLGIWVGDALLYLAARGMGHRIFSFSWMRRWATPAAVERSEAWFARQGTWLLVTSRFVPGMRLPTYLTAGFLRLPFARFLLITGLVVLVWTILIFAAAEVIGPRLIYWLDRLKLGNWVMVPMVGLAVAGMRTLPRLFRRGISRGWRVARERWRRWEFWPAGFFYIPVALNGLRLAVKYGGLTTPTAANPGIFSGGMVGESKYSTLRDLFRSCPEATAEAWLLEGGEFPDRQRALARVVDQYGLTVPFVLKPDIGQRGLGVKRIECLSEAEAYLQHTQAPLVVQRYVPGPFEAGVFYYRFPREASGRVFAITEKVFPEIVGDGQRTVEDLIRGDERARWIADRYLRRIESRRHAILAPGERISLVSTGNHAQGCIFRDGSRWLTPLLEERFDAIARAVPGFFIGRFDVRFGSEHEFQHGGGFQIVELNGASAEATHIYDARNSIRQAYATLFRQWELVFAIGAANRALGAPTTPVGELWRRWLEANRLFKTYPLAD